MRWLWVLLFATALVAYLGCSRKAPAYGKGDKGGGEVSVAQIKDQITEHVADALDVSASAVEVELVKTPEVPGLTVFTAHIPSAKPGRPGRYRYGVAGDGEVTTDSGAAVRRVMRALDYRAGNQMPPAQVAELLAHFQGGSRDPAWAVSTQADIDALAEGDRAGLTLPRALAIGGLPAIEYWITSSERPPRKVQAVVEADFSVRYQIVEP